MMSEEVKKLLEAYKNKTRFYKGWVLCGSTFSRILISSNKYSQMIREAIDSKSFKIKIK